MTRNWVVREAGSNRTGVYYQLNLRTKGEMVAPVVVKHSTRHNTMVCLTCVSADKCEHSRFVREYVEQNPTEKTA